MKLKNSLFSLTLMLAGLSLFSCATTVGMTVDRPAEVDLNGAKVLEVLPFQISDKTRTSSLFDTDYYFNNSYRRNNRDEMEIIDSFQTLVEESIKSTGYYNLLSTQSYKDYIKSRNDNSTDVYMIGEIYNYRNRVEKSETKKVDGDNIKILTSYQRVVEFNFAYQFIEAGTTNVLYSNSFSVSESSYSKDNESELPTPYSIVKNTLSSKASYIARSIKPNKEYRSLSLLNKKKNDDMELANKYAKNGLIEESYKKYVSIYEASYLFEAGYNAAVILEAQGRLEEAQELARKLTRTGDKRAFKLLNDINYEIKQRDAYLSQQKKNNR